jgi:hypothetical protein
MKVAQSELVFPPDVEIVSWVRQTSRVPADHGPNDARVLDAVKAVARTFEYWYSRVMKEAVEKYREVVVHRINPYIRRMQLEGLTPEAVATRLVADYESRNFVTAGGWFLESLAVNIATDGKKSLVEGLDLERQDHNVLHLYVLKSGTVTRNSDILKALKQNVRRAEKLNKQVKTGTGTVVGNYVQMTGCSAETHIEDGVRRPSSAKFWSEITGIPPEEAIELTLAVAAMAGRIASPDSSRHVAAMELLVAEYIRDPAETDSVDWKFIAGVTMRGCAHDPDMREEDRRRDSRARVALAATGYQLFTKPRAATRSRASKRKKT